MRYYEKNSLRDFTILTVMLGTGIRVSECVGLDLKDIDFDELRKINNDSAGWIRVNGTNINYPVMQNANFYLRKKMVHHP